ncbi:MAG: hypothetical protein ABIQ31_18440 [Ferruginibacter sp.]
MKSLVPRYFDSRSSVAPGYYKERHITGAPINANHLHELFKDTLKTFEFKYEHITLLKEKILTILYEKLKDHLQDQAHVKKCLSELTKKIENLEIKYIEENMEKRLYEKFLLKYQADKIELEQKLINHTANSSNLEKSVLKGLEIAKNISAVWTSSDFYGKQKLQNLVFPEGILYNKEKDAFKL